MIGYEVNPVIIVNHLNNKLFTSVKLVKLLWDFKLKVTALEKKFRSLHSTPWISIVWIENSLIWRTIPKTIKCQCTTEFPQLQIRMLRTSFLFVLWHFGKKAY